MNRTSFRRTLVGFCGLVVFTAASAIAAGQTASTEEIRKGKVVYVSGNDLVVKMADGHLKHFVVPKDARFTIDGKQVGVESLQPGTELTQKITTTRKDTTVTDVKTIDAKVWQVNAPWVTVTLPDGTNKRVRVPDGTKFTVAGEQKTVFDLKPGMQLTGTIVTKTPETQVSSRSRVTGSSPPPTPDLVGVLLIEEIEVPAP